MTHIKSLLRSPEFAEASLLFVASAIVYLIFLPWLGYFKDDWYLMYAAGAKGALAFKDIYIVDRPLRALVMTPAYLLFGSNPLYYNLSAWFFRVFASLGFLQLMHLMWPRQRMLRITAAVLFVLYPGFLSQFNGIDYQAQMVSLAAGMFSVVLTIYAFQTSDFRRAAGSLLISFILTILYLGLVEYFIGLEVVRVVCILLLVLREDTSWSRRVKKLMAGWGSALSAVMVFLSWRLFFFESERGATDVDLQLGDVKAHPFLFLSRWSLILLNDIIETILSAWVVPFRRLESALHNMEWLGGLGITVLLLMAWLAFQRSQMPGEEDAGTESSWRREAFWLAFTFILFGLVPVILVGRSVNFNSFSRYALLSSAGVGLLWALGLGMIPNRILRNILFGLLLVSTCMTHYVNGLVHIHETERMSRFWWQVSWRVPQFQQGTTLIADYPAITIEEDYFVWGPASLIYYPDSRHPNYPQPGVYAVLMNDDTVTNVLVRKPQEFSDRRSIVTYPNHRNILIITQPTLDSCVHVIDGRQPEFSSSEDERFVQIGSFSEVGHVLEDEPFRVPPIIPFGSEPAHDWCFYYEKAAFARQAGDWEEVIRLGKQAFELELFPRDQIEWMPFLQAYAISADVVGLREVDVRLTDPFVRQQACTILINTGQTPTETRTEAQNLFCR